MLATLYEIGKNTNYSAENEEFSTYFSAFISEMNKKYISDPFNHRVICINENGDKEYIYHGKHKNWFPRWVIPYGKKILYVDRNKNLVGFIENRNITEKCIKGMDVLISASISYDGNIILCGRGEYSVIELDEDLNVINKYFSAGFNIQSAQKISEDSFLLCDIFRHQVFVCNSEGKIVWEHGKPNQPGHYINELSTPKYACLFEGKVYIADGMNNRVKVIDYNTGRIERIITHSNRRRLWQPTCLQVLGEDKLLICDSFNERVIEVTANDNVSWEFGAKKNRVSFELNNPRIIEKWKDTLLIANSYNNNVIKISEKNEIEKFFGGTRKELFWPKSVKVSNRDTFLIADSRNGRIVEINFVGKVVNEIKKINFEGRQISLIDPHDIDEFEDGTLVITDATLNLIIRTDWSGQTEWLYGLNNEVNDPHQCRIQENGNLIVSDTGNHRVIELNENVEVVRIISETSAGRLFRPRWCIELNNEYFLITDSGNNRILILKKNGEVDYQFGDKWGNSIRNLREPRCAIIRYNKMFISDTINNRLVILEDDNLIKYSK